MKFLDTRNQGQCLFFQLGIHVPDQDVRDHYATEDESLAPGVKIPKLPAEVNVEPTRNRHPPDRL